MSNWPTCPVVTCCNMPEQWSHLFLFKGSGDMRSERDRQKENEDKLVGGREKIGDL